MISKEWKIYKIDEIAEFLNTKRIPLNSRERGIKRGSYPYYGASGIVDYLNDYTFDGNFVLISEDGENLRTRKTPIAFKVNGKFRVNNHAHIVRAKEPFLNDWIVYFFQNFNLNPFITGAVQPKLNKENLQLIEIPIPELKVAKKIITILSSLDDKIELNRQTNQTLEGIAQTLFQEMCVQKGDELPEGWRVGKLGDVCGLNKNTLNKKIDSPEWIDYIEISEVSKGVIGNITRYIYGEEPSRAKRKLKHGDTILSTVRPDRGSYFLAVNPPETNIVSTGFAVFTATKVPYTFLYVFLTDESSLNYYGQVANGGAYPAINPNVIMDMDVIIPEYTVLNEFHKITEPLFLQYYTNEQENLTLIAMRDSLLPKLMKGEIEI